MKRLPNKPKITRPAPSSRKVPGSGTSDMAEDASVILAAKAVVTVIAAAPASRENVFKCKPLFLLKFAYGLRVRLRREIGNEARGLFVRLKRRGRVEAQKGTPTAIRLILLMLRMVRMEEKY
jgi:hypothetical protein